MTDPGKAWWMTENGEWRWGYPPPGWWQATDCHWYPPQAETTATPLTDHQQMADVRSGSPSHGEPPSAAGPGLAPLDRYRGLPFWAQVTTPIALVVILVLAIAAFDGGSDAGDPDLTAADATTTTERAVTTTERPTTTTTTSTSTSTTTTTTTAPPTTHPPTTAAPPPTQPPTTAPAPPPPPPTQAPAPPSASTVTPGAFCTPAGATGVTTTGLSMTCATQKCDGEPYTQARWRRTSC